VYSFLELVEVEKCYVLPGYPMDRCEEILVEPPTDAEMYWFL
jgi:hypothetical protein